MVTRNTNNTCVLTAFVICALFVDQIACEKYKLCVVDGRGSFKRSGRYCPILDHPDSKVECVLGVDRLDCLRRISKGTVDFSVFTPEDLVTATNSEIEVLITNELRYTQDDYEYEVVAVVGDSSGIKSKHDLKDKRFCHPGYGYETDWTRILANYLEASTIPQSCLTHYTITENRIKASSEFFNSACKAGPWVHNPKLDLELKAKYRNLCQLCDNPSICDKQDKYWGRRGSLMCLTDGAGDVSWARLDDVRVHFGLVPGGAESTPDGYSFLCRDGTTKPVNSTTPCVWVVKPWPAIATRRKVAQEIQDFISTLDQVENYSWQAALLNLVESFHLSIKKLQPIEPIESYLERATGFLNANSFTGCHPPRTIRICTTSVLENAKCSWLRESSAVYGIQPDLDCLKAENTTHCMQALNHNAADVVMVPPDLVAQARRSYNLAPLFYETVHDNSKYLTVGVTRADTAVATLEELRGRKVCFPVYDGVAWNTVRHALSGKNLACDLSNFFGAICAPNSPKSSCNSGYRGDFGALRCLLDGTGDVAFISQNSLSEFIKSPLENKFGNIKRDSFNILCEDKSNGCHLSWASAGLAMVRANSTNLWRQDTVDVFLQLDSLFGRSYKSPTTPLQLFGAFNGQSDVLFHDVTVRLRSVPTARDLDTMKRNYQEIFVGEKQCSRGAVPAMSMTLFVFIVFLIGY